MNKNLLMIILAIIILIGLGVGGYLAFISEDDESQSSTPTQQTTTTNEVDQAQGTSKEFKPLAMKDRAFEAKLVGVSGNSEMNATILSDGKGNSKYTGESDGQTFESYITADGEYIICNEDSCFKFPSSQEQAGLNPKNYTYSEEDYDEFRSIAKYIGTDECPAGTCDVWEITQDDTTTKVFIADDSYVSKLTADNEEGSFTYTYDYKDVSFDVPKNVQSLPTPATP